MNHYLNKAKDNVKRIWIEVFWKNPHHLWALKTTVSVALLLIPTVLIFNNYFIGSSLTLGAVAMASTETDMNARGRLKSAGITLLLFFITSSVVGLLTSYSIIFGAVLGIMIFALTLMAGVNTRLQGISFGTLLFITYAMLALRPSIEWYYQPVLYVLGAAFYTIISITLLYIKPYRLLRGELSTGFSYLAKYMELKSQLFPSKPEEQERILNKLAQQNMRLAQQVEVCKNGLQWFFAESNPKVYSELNVYYRKWFKLQELQERATSSQISYDILSKEIENKNLIEGFGQLMHELAKAIDEYADSLLINEPYIQLFSLEWTSKTVRRLLDIDKESTQNYTTLSSLLDTLVGIEESLQQDDNKKQQDNKANLSFRESKSYPISSFLTPYHPRFRFATRMTLCLIIGYIIMHVFNIEKGTWILMTSLIVCQQTYSAMRQRLFSRIVGTLLGVFTGAFLGLLLPNVLGQLLMLLGTIYGIYYFLKRNYIAAVIFITIYVYATFNLLSGDGEAYMLPRVMDTFIGGFLAYVVVRFIWPDWQYNRIPSLLSVAIERNRTYFDAVCSNSISPSDYITSRRAAYNADNDLTATWKDMRLEPKNREEYHNKVFRLTYLNHTLLSYIAALGIYNKDVSKDLNDNEKTLCNYVNQILEITQNIVSQDDNDDAQNNKSKEIEQKMDAITSSSINQRILLTQNIARISKELLSEAQGLNEHLTN